MWVTAPNVYGFFMKKLLNLVIVYKKLFLILMEHTMILKEEIGQYDIVPSLEEKKGQLKQELSYAERLGNEFKGKATITFETTRGARTVQTTVWSLTENYIVLKGGITVPLNSITEVHF